MKLLSIVLLFKSASFFTACGDAKITLQNSSKERFNAFASILFRVHRKATDELKSMAPNKSLFLPTQPMSEHMKQIDMLKGKVGGAFDKVYMNHMVMDHQEDVSEFQKASTSVKDVDLKAFIPQPACLENAFRLCKSHF